MKTLTAILLLTFSVTSFAARLGNDFKCEAKNKDGDTFEVIIPDVDYAREVVVAKGRKACNFQIESAKFSDRGAVASLLIRYTSPQTCLLSKKVQPQKNGNIKVFLEDKPKAQVLSILDHAGLDCVVKEFNRKKLQDRFSN